MGFLCCGGDFLACSKSNIITLLEKANGSDFSIKLDCVLEQGYMILAIGATLILELVFVLKPIWQHFDSPFDTLQFLILRPRNRIQETSEWCRILHLQFQQMSQTVSSVSFTPVGNKQSLIHWWSKPKLGFMGTREFLDPLAKILQI